MKSDAKSVEDAIKILKRYFGVKEYLVKNSFPLDQIINAGDSIILSVLHTLGAEPEEIEALDERGRESSKRIKERGAN